MELEFLLKLFPAALADSINPCAFAILFIILSSVLSGWGNGKRVLFTGLAFTFSIFLSYYLMGVGLYHAFAFSGQAELLKIISAFLAIIIWLANIKDYFWFGKYFTMEMPTVFKTASRKWLKKIHSPIWAFLIGILISLFLLPCTGWPYFTIIALMASDSAMTQLTGYVYLLIYNLIFIIPFALITILVALWNADVAVLKEYRETYKQEIHLVVWLLMLGLGLYLLGDLYLWNYE